MGNAVRRLIAIGIVIVACGCGGDRHPDSGYGGNQTPPTTLNCRDLCRRIGDCAVQLCNEDTRSTDYSGLEDLLIIDCEDSCTDAAVHENFTPAQWQCMFRSSCRQTFDYDDCRVDGNYHC